MATFDQLSAEQRAIVELVLKQGQNYGQLAEMLSMTEARVAELARDALMTLSPVSAAAVDEDWRGPIADYLLGQQRELEATATRGHMRGSESARAWSRSLLDSLEQFYDPADLPAIPEPEAAAPSARRTGRLQQRKKPAQEPSDDVEPGQDQLSPEAQAIVRRRRVAGAATFAALGLLALLVWPVGLLTGGDDDEKAAASKDRRPPARVVGQLVLRSIEGAKGMGVAAVAQRGKSRSLIVQARLPANANREAYEVWLYNSDSDARSLGAQVTDGRGTFQGASVLPADFGRFKFIDVSLENVDREPAHSGKSVLRGRIDQFELPPSGARQPGTQTQP
ncbi:MAG: anti-sigma factor [Thermoleophilaceae bacterium]|nr:anti-sigma factor [Thermoleophilaceae bacterium]